MHQAPIASAWTAISAIAHSAPAIARIRRSRGASANPSAIAAVKNAMPSTGIGMPSGCAHADSRTVAQPASAQNVGLAPA